MLQRQRSVLLATSSLATRGTPTPRATTEMVSPKLGRGLVASDNIIDLSEGVKPSKQKVRGWEACGGICACQCMHGGSGHGCVNYELDVCKFYSVYYVVLFAVFFIFYRGALTYIYRQIAFCATLPLLG